MAKDVPGSGAPTSRRDAAAHGGDCAQSNSDPSNMLASRRCAAQVAAALKKLGYGFAVIPATAKPSRASREG
jgi:hypothetical protein